MPESSIPVGTLGESPNLFGPPNGFGPRGGVREREVEGSGGGCVPVGAWLKDCAIARSSRGEERAGRVRATLGKDGPVRPVQPEGRTRGGFRFTLGRGGTLKAV